MIVGGLLGCAAANRARPAPTLLPVTRALRVRRPTPNLTGARRRDPMLSWIFKKFGRNAASATTKPAGKQSAPTPAQTRQAKQVAEQITEQKAAEKAAQKTQKLAAAKADWAPRLQAARGDDAALLALLQAAPLLDIKLAAVEALAGEAALKQAEREARNSDRRVHRLAKSRLEAAVAQREARAQAQALIASATELSAQADLPINVLVNLDRAWLALDAALLEPLQVEQFNALSAALNSQLRQRSELEQQQQRWAAEASQGLSAWGLAAEQAVANGRPGELKPQPLLDLQQRCPDLSGQPTGAALALRLEQAVLAGAQIEARLIWLDGLGLETAEPLQQWQAMQPLADAGLARLLNQRFEQSLRALAPVDAEPVPTATPRNRPTASAARPEQIQAFEAKLAQAEAALAGGELSELQQLLQQIDAHLQGVNPASLPDDARARQHALLTERNRLRDWEQWGGALALDALVAEAEELARTTRATVPAEAAEADANVEALPVAKLNLKAHREAIQALRKRWKEVDGLSAGAGQALWQRFDTAMQTANQPVAAQLAELKLAREANLVSRELLLNQLDALPGVGVSDASAPLGEAASAQWKECLRALSAFQLAWRQLGPLEHTVPLANRDALLRRQRASLERIEAPLQRARRAAETQRLLLIERAEALLQELRENSQLRDLTQRVRDLQAEWQQQARGLPLARSTENDLWARFKAATDAVFTQRSAAFDARDEALAASLAEYETLLARLEALNAETADAEIRRTLDEVDRAWRQGGELPRHQANALDGRLQAAHALALQILAGRSQMIWQAQCEALTAKLALCELAEGTEARLDEAEFAARWAALPALPEAWEQALARRAPADANLDEALLQLEAGLDLPASEEMLAARRLLKLKAMKDALEGRGSKQSSVEQQAACMAALLQASNASPAQLERLHGLVRALAQAPVGSWLAPHGGR